MTGDDTAVRQAVDWCTSGLPELGSEPGPAPRAAHNEHPFHGVRIPVLRGLAREWVQGNGTMAADAVLGVAAKH